ncbi:hypothetical protein [Amycolatopsis jiangsuensis]|uniref:Uncharacterized protein n=1 Tax=Amycolatopsis jiangsuensis TaxID=1181879 RepID=A0A840IRD2_9PSEU|nr:hypothetical protein [Amycolatopsis jiangsuensis]MBB4685121.1 hypothetical protein [Amycolatopsis jiangsuensis]
MSADEPGRDRARVVAIAVGGAGPADYLPGGELTVGLAGTRTEHQLDPAPGDRPQPGRMHGPLSPRHRTGAGTG